MKLKIIIFAVVLTICFIVYSLRGFRVSVLHPLGGEAIIELIRLDADLVAEAQQMVSAKYLGVPEVRSALITLKKHNKYQYSMSKGGKSNFRGATSWYLVALEGGNSYAFLKVVFISGPQVISFDVNDLHEFGIVPEIENYLNNLKLNALRE